MARGGELTDKQQAFVDEYMRDFNGTQAAIRAGYSRRTAQEQASALLSKPIIAEVVARAKAERAARAGIDADRVLEEIKAIALARLGDFAEWDGDHFTLVPSHDIDPETGERVENVDTRVIESVTFKEVTYSTDNGEVTKIERGIKMHNKLAALEKLAKHLGIVVDRKEISGPGGDAVQVEVKARDYRQALGAFLPAADEGES